MTVTAADVLALAGAGPADETTAAAVLDEAQVYVGDYIDHHLIDLSNPVPTVLRDACVLTCAGDLFARRKAPFGAQVMPDPSGTPVTTRLGSDPLGGVRPMLSAYCMAIGFAFPEEST